MTILSGVLWFVAGIMFNKAFSSVIEFGILGRAVEKVTNDLLLVLVLAEQDIQFVLESKRLILKEKGMSENDIEHYIMIHERSFRMWREKVIVTLVNNYPEAYKEKYLPFTNWNGAVKHINEMFKTQKEELANKQ